MLKETKWVGVAMSTAVSMMVTSGIYTFMAAHAELSFAAAAEYFDGEEGLVSIIGLKRLTMSLISLQPTRMATASGGKYSALELAEYMQDYLMNRKWLSEGAETLRAVALDILTDPPLQPSFLELVSTHGGLAVTASGN